MSEREGPRTTIYLLQETRDAPVSLCAIDHESGLFHKFHLSVQNAARLASECSAFVADSHGTPNLKFATKEITAALSSKWQAER